MKKAAVVYVFMAVLFLFLASCGKKETDGGGQDPPEYSYVPEYVELAKSMYTSYQDVRYVGQNVYYNQTFFDVVNQANVPVLKEYSLAENKVLKEMDMLGDAEDGRKRQIGHYFVQEDKSLYTEESVYSRSDRDTLLCAYDAEWNLRWEQNITDVMNEVQKYSIVEQMAVDKEGRICLVVEDTLCLFDADGVHLGNVELEDTWIGTAGTGGDGKVYVSFREQMNAAEHDYCLAEVDFEKIQLGSICRNFPDVPPGRTFAAGQEADILVFDTNYLYEYDLADQSAREVLAWVECGLNGSGVEAVSVGEDEGLLAFWQDVEEGFLVSLEKTETALLPEKTQVVIGCLGDSYILEKTAAAFNRQSESCHVAIRNYGKENGDVQDSITALSVALATGSDCPDILDLDQMEAYGMDIEAIAGNGAFADLEPFLTRSSQPEMGEEHSWHSNTDYLENALECYRYHGILVGIPCGLQLYTVAGKSSDVGGEPGWTLEEMLAYAAAHPQQELFDGADRESILHDCLVFGLDAFIDRESGKCYFDSEDFRELLAFAAAFPEEYDYQADDRTTPGKIQDGDVLLYKAWISKFYSIQEQYAMFGPEVTYIGFPAADGIGCIMECSGALALSANSENQEAAWEFIEYYLDRQSDRSRMGDFPTRKSMLDKQMENAMTVSYYLDDDGNLLLDAEGMPVLRFLGSVQWSFNDAPVVFRTATEEEVQCVMELIVSARSVRAADDKIMEIIRLEAEPFFQGQKSVEEVTDIIQNRVQLYLDGR